MGKRPFAGNSKKPNQEKHGRGIKPATPVTFDGPGTMMKIKELVTDIHHYHGEYGGTQKPQKPQLVNIHLSMQKVGKTLNQLDITNDSRKTIKTHFKMAGMTFQ